MANLTAQQRQQRFIWARNYVASIEVQLAAAAWTGFCRHGKGYLVIHPTRNQLSSVHWVFTSSDFYRSLKITQSPLYEAVEGCNPNKEIVVVMSYVLMDGQDDVYFFHFTPQMGPRECAAAVKLRPTEFAFKRWDFD